MILSSCRFYQVSPKLFYSRLPMYNLGFLKFDFATFYNLKKNIFVACHPSQDLLTVTGRISQRSKSLSALRPFLQ